MSFLPTLNLTPEQKAALSTVTTAPWGSLATTALTPAKTATPAAATTAVAMPTTAATIPATVAPAAAGIVPGVSNTTLILLAVIAFLIWKR